MYTIPQARRRILEAGGSLERLPRERVRPAGRRAYWAQPYLVRFPLANGSFLARQGDRFTVSALVSLHLAP